MLTLRVFVADSGVDFLRALGGRAAGGDVRTNTSPFASVGDTVHGSVR